MNYVPTVLAGCAIIIAAVAVFLVWRWWKNRG